MDRSPRDFRKLEVWQEGHALTLAMYKATAGFPDTERFGLASQLRRASSSIPNNIAEGCGRGGTVELARFMRNSRGSAFEVDYLIQLAHDLEYFSREQAAKLYRQVRKLNKKLTNYITQLENDNKSQ